MLSKKLNLFSLFKILFFSNLNILSFLKYINSCFIILLSSLDKPYIFMLSNLNILSYFLLNNPYLVIPVSFFGIYFLLYFSQNTFSNYVLVVLLLITFSSGYFIFQKYFEPMFYIIFLNYFDKNKILQSIEKSNYVVLFYFVTYYIASNYIYFLGL